MKRVRILLLLLLPLLLISLNGCKSKSYSYDFTEERKLTRIDGDWFAVNEDYEIGPLGLVLNDCRVWAPHYYIGDFDIAITFETDSEATYTGIIEVLLSTSREFVGSDWYGGIVIIGTSSDSAFMDSKYNDSGSGLQPVDSNVAIGDKLNKDGTNVLKLIKKGSTLKFVLNDKPIGSTMNIVGNSTDFNIPCIYGGGFEGLAPVVFKSFEVNYWGDQNLI